MARQQREKRLIPAIPPKLMQNYISIYDSVPAQRIDKFEIVKTDGAITLIQHINGRSIWMFLDNTNELSMYKSLPEIVRGKVLIAGLGLGFDALNVADRDNVDEIIIIEKQQSVIDLVWPYISHQKTILICQDVSEYLQETDETFDIIYFDIFPGTKGTSPKEAIKLEEIAQSRLKPDGQILFWGE